MRIINIGVDIEDISRFSKLEYEENKNFYEKIFTDKEIDYCLKRPNPYQHFAARFCAKEAFIKAFSKKKIDYKSIEIKIKDDKPYIEWVKNKVFVSLAHEKDKAIAFVIIEK